MKKAARFLVATAVAALLTLSRGTYAQTGHALWECWRGIGGVAVAQLTGDSRYPEAPTDVRTLASLEAPVKLGDSYGARVRALVHPPATGDYRFLISGDDNCELWLSTGEAPDGARIVARVPGWTKPGVWDKYPEQRSEAIRLEAGRRYYLEALHKEGHGGDHLAVGWELPDGTLECPAPGMRLSMPQVEDYARWVHSERVYLSTAAAGADVSNDVHNFPVAIRLSGTDFNFGEWGDPATGGDLRFATADGEPLPYEIETWVNEPQYGNDNALIWVRVPHIAANTNEQYIMMYWGNVDAPDLSCARAVFGYDEQYAAVWHLSDSPGDGEGHQDATGGAPALVPRNSGHNGGRNPDAPGLMGGGVLLDGISDCYAVRKSRLLDLADKMTVSCWVYEVARGGVRTVVSYDGTHVSDYSLAIEDDGTAGRRPVFTWVNGDGETVRNIANRTIASAAWQHVLAQRDGDEVRIFVNGVDASTPSVPAAAGGAHGTPGPGDGRLNVGTGEKKGQTFGGGLDELRLGSAGRSAEWVKLCYENQRPEQTLVWFGTPPSQALAPPANVVAVPDSVGYRISWTDRADNEEGYTVLYGPSPESLDLLGRVAADVTSYHFIDGSCGDLYFFAVKSYSGDIESEPAVSTDPAYALPCSPTGIAATALSRTEVRVAWQGNASHYIVQSMAVGGAWQELGLVPTSTVTHDDAGCGMTYSYRVAAVNQRGRSPWSDVVQVSTPRCPIRNPTDLSADASTPGLVRLTWVDNAVNESGYRVYRSAKRNARPQMLVDALPANTEAYDDATVECDQQYIYRVEAYDAVGRSARSNRVVVKTLYCGAGKDTEDMITVSGILVGRRRRMSDIHPRIVAQLYLTPEPEDVTPVYEEAFKDVAVTEGFFTLPLGLTGDVASVVREYTSLYYDILVDGQSVFPEGRRRPLTSSPYALKTHYALHGVGSPVGEVSAPSGASYVDTEAKELYIKAGAEDDDWVKMGN